WHKSAFVAHHQKNRHPKAPAILFKFMNECSGIRCSGTGVQQSDGAAVLRPARDVVTDRDRAFLAVGDGPHPARIDTARGEVGANRLGAASAKGNVVFAGTALVGVTLD